MSSGRASRGFTLIEMLVVISIITILGGLLLVAISAARSRAMISRTDAQIKLISAAILRYEQDFQDFPPGAGDEEGLEGAESLLECLSTEKKEGPYLKAGEVPTSDVDGDGRYEMEDAWRQPIRYWHHRDYRNQPPRKGDFRLISNGPNRQFEGGAPESDDVVNWDRERPQ